MVKIRLLLFYLLLLPTLCWAQTSLHTEVDPTSGALDDEYLFSVEIHGQGQVNYPTLENDEDFKISLIGPEQRVNIVNGAVTQSIIFRYKLTPKRPGKLATPSVKVKIAGEELSAKSLEVSVSSQKSSASADNPFKLQQSVSNYSGYVGEQLSYSLDIQASQRLRQIQPNFASFDNFWVQDYEESKQLMRGMQSHGLGPSKPRFKKALFPLKPGRLEISPSKATVLVPKTNRRRGSPWDSDPFDLFNHSSPLGGSIFAELFDQEYTEKKLESNALTVDIKELPPAPPDHQVSSPSQVLVGETSVRIEYSSDIIKPGESKAVEIAVTSFGNLNPIDIDSLPLLLPSWIGKYDDAPQLNSIEKNGKLQFTKIFKFFLVPQAGGEVKIPGIKLSYFDPESASYKYAQSNPIIFEVDGPAASTSPSAPAETNSSPKATTPSQTTPSATPVAAPALAYQEVSWLTMLFKKFSLELILFTLVGLSLLAAALLLLRKKQKAKLPLNRIRHQIKTAETLDLISTAFKQWLQIRFGIKASDPIEVNNKISNTELRFVVNDIQDQLNLAIFGGENAKNNQINSLKIRILDLIDRL